MGCKEKLNYNYQDHRNFPLYTKQRVHNRRVTWGQSFHSAQLWHIPAPAQHRKRSKEKCLEEKTCQRGQRTEQRKWKGRQGHELRFHLHCPPQFFHRKACVAIKQWGQILKYALSHWTARQESIDSLLLTNRSRTHTQGVGQSRLFINNFQEGIHPHTHSPAVPVSTTQGNVVYFPILFYISGSCQRL